MPEALRQRLLADPPAFHHWDGARRIGGHGLDTVFNDFVYLNDVLKPGGLLAIDDIQLGSCRLLSEWLGQSKMGFAVVDRTPKLAILRKVADRRFVGDFGLHASFLERLSGCLGGPP